MFIALLAIDLVVMLWGSVGANTYMPTRFVWFPVSFSGEIVARVVRFGTISISVPGGCRWECAVGGRSYRCRLGFKAVDMAQQGLHGVQGNTVAGMTPTGQHESACCLVELVPCECCAGCQVGKTLAVHLARGDNLGCVCWCFGGLVVWCVRPVFVGGPHYAAASESTLFACSRFTSSLRSAFDLPAMRAVLMAFTS